MSKAHNSRVTFKEITAAVWPQNKAKLEDKACQFSSLAKLVRNQNAAGIAYAGKTFALQSVFKGASFEHRNLPKVKIDRRFTVGSAAVYSIRLGRHRSLHLPAARVSSSFGKYLAAQAMPPKGAA
jgi:hypothetical protein